MITGNKKKDEKDVETPNIKRSLREYASDRLASSSKTAPDLEGQAYIDLIHELQVHQIELEMQAEDYGHILNWKSNGTRISTCTSSHRSDISR